MKLKNLFDNELLNKHIIDRVVSQMKHPVHKNLAILNYTHVAQHENIWDDVTEQCRGLIYDTITDEVIARPFRKFFNLNTSFRPETHEANLPQRKPRVLDKLDGSLGILYDYRGELAIATRGSFASDQAKWATEWYKQVMGKHSWPIGHTALFEIIYKENRIVVNYDYEGLVLLGLVNIETGHEVPPEEVSSWGQRNGLQVASEYVESTLSQCKQDATPNREGFVLQYWPELPTAPLRIKVKTEDYVRLHKVITGLNPKGIWEHMMLGYNPDALWMPASSNQIFTKWCIGWIHTFQGMYDKLEDETIKAFGRASVAARKDIALLLASDAGAPNEKFVRKSFAMAFQKEQARLSSALFAMHDGKDYKPALWKLIEPMMEGKEVFLRDGDKFNGL